jgi:hypothetical protein
MKHLEFSKLKTVVAASERKERESWYLDYQYSIGHGHGVMVRARVGRMSLRHSKLMSSFYYENRRSGFRSTLIQYCRPWRHSISIKSNSN